MSNTSTPDSKLKAQSHEAHRLHCTVHRPWGLLRLDPGQFALTHLVSPHSKLKPAPSLHLRQVATGQLRKIGSSNVIHEIFRAPDLRSIPASWGRSFATLDSKCTKFKCLMMLFHQT